jgi:peptide deformylase
MKTISLFPFLQSSIEGDRCGAIDKLRDFNMADKRPISQLGDPVLRQTARPISNVQDDWVQPLIDDLILTLIQSQGVGISAPQVGSPHRIVVMASHPNERYPDAPMMEPTVLINPRMIDHSEACVTDWEGCLSIPNIRGRVPRYQAVEVEYTTPAGKLQRQVFTDFIARIFQHEFDHLEGMVFLDRLQQPQELMTEQEYRQRVLTPVLAGR